MGIRITTDDYGVKVWRSDRHGFPQYAVAISIKTDSGERISEYKQVQFRRGVELENGEEICIDGGFPTLRTWKDRQTGEERSKEVWMITDFRYRKQAPPKQSLQDTIEDLPDSFAAAEDDIPF